MKDLIANLFLSRVNIDKAVETAGNSALFRPFYKLTAQFLIDRSYPRHLFIESTRACNLKCNSCPGHLSGREPGDMDFGLFRKIIDEASLFGPRNFSLHMFGEPLLNKRIKDMVEYIKTSGGRHSVFLTTNGYFLDNDMAESLIKNKIDKITFSLFSLRAEKMKDLTGSGNIEKVLGNIENAVLMNKKMGGGTGIFIRFLLRGENKDELEEVKKTARRLGVFLRVRKTHNYGGVIKNDYTANTFLKRRYPCYHFWFAPAVTWDGKVVACCSDWNYSAVLGDMNKETLSSIWQSGNLALMRWRHLRGEQEKMALCRDCNVWSLYPDIFFDFQKKRMDNE